MTPRDPHIEQELERLTHETLRRLPACRAPATLEARVLEQIERRAGARSGAGIGRWPLAARAALIAGCGVCVPLVWLLGSRLWSHVSEVAATPGVAHRITGIRSTGHILISLTEIASHVARLIPKEWLFGGLIVTSVVYATLIAVGYLLLYPTLPHSKVHSV